MFRAQRNHEIQTLAPHCSDQPFAIRVRFRCPHRRAQHSRPKRAFELLIQLRREDRIASMDQELVRMVAWNGFSELLQRPLRGRMCGHVVMENPTAFYLHHDENIQHPESGRDRNQEVTSHDALRMILDEGSPVLRRRSGAPGPSGCVGQYLRTVRGETRMPSFSQSSSATRSSPQVMFSLTIRAMSWRMSLGSGGRPPRDFQRQYSLKALRCRRTKVAGVTMASASFQSKSRDQSTSDNRAASVRRRGRIW